MVKPVEITTATARTNKLIRSVGDQEIVPPFSTAFVGCRERQFSFAFSAIGIMSAIRCP